MRNVPRIHVDRLEDPVIPSQKYTLISYLVPDHNIEAGVRPGFMVRGSFPDIESATAAASQFAVKLDTVVVETGRVVPSCPTIEEMKSCPQKYSESELDDLVGGLNKRNKEANEQFDRHCEESKTRKDTREDLVGYVTAAEKKAEDANVYCASMKQKLYDFDRGVRD